MIDLAAEQSLGNLADRHEFHEGVFSAVIHHVRNVLDALIEDFVLEPSDKGTRLTWTMALTPRRGQALPLGALAPLLRPGNTVAIAGIKKILPS